MTQEILALAIFGLAVLFGAYKLGRSLLPVRKHHSSDCGSEACGCKTQK